MDKLISLFKSIEPILTKKIPMFNQNMKEFSTSKSNAIGIIMITTGLIFLYKHPISEFGLILFSNGLGLITIKDATTKRISDGSQ